MAVRLNSASSNALERTTNLPNLNSVYTIMGWVYVLTWPGPSEWSTIVSLNVFDNPGAAIGDWIQITEASGPTAHVFQLFVSDGTSGGSASNDTDFAVNTWYHFALVRNSNISAYAVINGIGECNNTRDVGTSRTAANVIEFGDTYVNSTRQEYFNGKIMGVKIWDTNLTQAEIQQEMNSLRPVRYANLKGFYPMFSGSGERTRDYSVDLTNFSEIGTITDEDPAPVGWGTKSYLPPIVVAGGIIVVPGVDTVVGAVVAPTVATGGAQAAFPTTDASLGSWKDQADGTTNIYTRIDEVVPDDTDYIKSPFAPSSNIYKTHITSLTDPSLSTGHVVHYRYQKNGTTTCNLKVRLKQGTTTIKEWTHANVASGFVSQAQTLSGGEADSITDYTDLYLEFEAY